MSRHVFDELGKDRVVAPIRPVNEPSIGVARKLGMRLEKTTLFAGFDHAIYVVTRDEWTRRGPGKLGVMESAR